MKTLKTIISNLRTLTEDHPQAYDFGYGPITDLNSQEHKFPIIWMTNTESTLHDTSINYNFDLWILNLTEQDQDNLEDTMSDMILIGKDILNSFRYGLDEQDVSMKEDVNIAPVTLNFDHILSGWRMSFDVSIITSYC